MRAVQVLETLGWLFVGHPIRILFVSATLLGIYSRRRGRTRGAQAIAVAGVVWAAYGIWEWLVITRTPEANIRIDLLLIWPILAVVSAWALFRILRRSR